MTYKYIWYMIDKDFTIKYIRNLGDNRMILLIVDTQNLIMTNDLYEFEIFVYRIKTLIKEARNNGIEVIYMLNMMMVAGPKK